MASASPSRAGTITSPKWRSSPTPMNTPTSATAKLATRSTSKATSWGNMSSAISKRDKHRCSRPNSASPIWLARDSSRPGTGPKLFRLVPLRPRAAKIEDQPKSERPGRPTHHFDEKRSPIRRVTRRIQRYRNRKQRHDETQPARDPHARFSTWNQNRVLIFRAVFSCRQLDRRRKHVKKRDEVENDGRVDEHLVGAARCLIVLAHPQHQSGNGGLHENRDIRRAPARMNLPKSFRQVSVNPNDKRNTGDAGHRTSHSP